MLIALAVVGFVFVALLALFQAFVPLHDSDGKRRPQRVAALVLLVLAIAGTATAREVWADKEARAKQQKVQKDHDEERTNDDKARQVLNRRLAQSKKDFDAARRESNEANAKIVAEQVAGRVQAVAEAKRAEEQRDTIARENAVLNSQVADLKEKARRLEGMVAILAENSPTRIARLDFQMQNRVDAIGSGAAPSDFPRTIYVQVSESEYLGLTCSETCYWANPSERTFVLTRRAEFPGKDMADNVKKGDKPGFRVNKYLLGQGGKYEIVDGELNIDGQRRGGQEFDFPQQPTPTVRVTL
ncbi:hypothetical protein [Alienimonas californiensis]|uniref:Uncharacterized protein n=1 Tax=Alienimonas californiensis TaxID=2527989 RepID=A0A517P7H4_9PLAN|nr:hypothetical protein [Alienimonas californiensis]QDT15337.1 hypothetical protein CA12_14210 [Alienimonas californiensis]